MNKVILVGLTSLNLKPELKVVANGRAVTTFVVVTEEDGGTVEYHNVVAWDEMATKASLLERGRRIAVEGRLHARAWDDERGIRHWKVEVIVVTLEVLS